MSLGCMRVAGLMARSAAGLSPADALRLEEHLEHCPDCRGDSAALERMRSLTEPERPLTDRARGRAIDAALRRAGERVAAPSRGRRATPWFLGAAAAAAAFSLLWLGGKWGDPDEKPEPLGQEGAGVPTHVAAAALQDSMGQVIRGEVTLEVARRRVDVVAEADSRVIVEASRVRVVAGSVLIVAADGHVINKRVVAGDSWELPAEQAAATETETAPETVTAAKTEAAPRKPAVDIAALLASATQHLAADEIPAARADLKSILATRPSRTRRAEAEGLLAQAQLMEGDVAGAVKAYLAVADRYRDLPAGERARFQAAKAEANFGSKTRARTLLESYLQQYPDGRFRNEARRRLDRL